MPKKKSPEKNRPDPSAVEGLEAVVREQPITETLETNYMPYAMSVIVSRAIPEIDGFKPSHRKLLYTMYKMGLLNGPRTKSANIVGQTMRLNPHGDSAIYDTLVRLSRGNGALLHPFIDSKGNFGKVYSRDMAYAASRYTEAKLDKICSEIFGDIDYDTVDFQDNYDNTMREPVLLPTAFPNILVSVNQGIAVGMACQICSFNLGEVCQTAIALIQNPEHDLFTTLTAPDFSTGGELVYNRSALEKIYNTGRGSFQLRARWRYVESLNLIEVFEIPYNTTIEAIMDETAKLIKAGKLKEISDMRDETDLNGLKLTIELKRGTNPDSLMQKLMKSTSLVKYYPCNFNLLISGIPRQMGVREILEEWTAWRTECVKRRIYHELTQKRSKLHLLKGLESILLDIDKAIRIIRNTERESEVIPNLMIGFGIDEAQAEYIAEIKLRNINREFILKRIEEIASLEKDIEDRERTLGSRRLLLGVIVSELREIAKKYALPRRTAIVYESDIAREPEEEIPDYPVHIFLSKEGYFKKITPLSLRMGGAQKYKPGDGPQWETEAFNSSEFLVFSDKGRSYPSRVSDFPDMKASVLGEYLPARLGMDEGENIVALCMCGDYTGNIVIAFENGKAVKVPLLSYMTKTNRRKLTGAYNTSSPVVGIIQLGADAPLAFFSTDGRALIVDSALIPLKTTRTSQGVAVMRLKPKHSLKSVMLLENSGITNKSRYTVKSVPAAGSLLKPEDLQEKQINIEGF
ncbi:MAG: topoisomerase IV [Clostridiales bacterium]|jgi:DNA gyrase subunit A|nr:topoisomerase IV [Clostridiales bacterium]